ncbi:hypothetical protein [Paenibacillus odorifer]|uniref:hypothetical protein n=1 Tax=Paenibacillus odorifer TaxID=189426 RepID=UPI000BA0D061|nr:hypothetical protein [Paenibacillus odorifer]OZQ78082.1 hypothetical protein CA596_04995 [Paenibacillus odorifer]
MLKKTALLILSFLLLLLPHSITAHADTQVSSATKLLSMEETIQLALTNYVDIKLSQWNIAETDSKFSYVSSEKKKLEQKNVVITSGLLPVNPDIFISSIPGYSDLSKEEQAGVNQSILIQIMINTSLNQWVSAQTESQNSYNQETKTAQLKEFRDQLRTLETDKVINQLRLQKTEALIRYYAVQKYYQLSSLKKTIEYDKQESQYWFQQSEDTLRSYEHGLLSKRSLDDFNRKNIVQKSIFERNLRSYEAQLEQFKLELGLSSYSEVLLDDVISSAPEPVNCNTVISLSSNYDLREEDARITLAKDNLDAAKASDAELITYYSVLWSSQIAHKNIVQQQLEEKLASYKPEANEIDFEYSELKEQQLELVRVSQDNDTLLNSGLISAAQADQDKLDLLNLNRQFDKQKVKYGLFQAKVTLALSGVIL